MRVLQLHCDNIEYTPTKKQSQILNNNFIWTPAEDEKGNHTITFVVGNGHVESSIQNTVFVDTLKKTTKNEKTFMLTTNKEFVLDISTPQTTDYEQIEGPENAWVSPQGVFHWIPI